jgi:hypothetical protein
MSKPLPKERAAASHRIPRSEVTLPKWLKLPSRTTRLSRLTALSRWLIAGPVVNPESVRSQTEGAIIYGLSAALKHTITIKNGAVEQTNFDGYEPIRQRSSTHRSLYCA